mmetsp:Transcript_27623/g.80690  ORF Transcript_27623/g.80690 Transcript_27623/m.80690 type:complete len:307 (+) Transcript_27623:2174-3094(+)
MSRSSRVLACRRKSSSLFRTTSTSGPFVAARLRPARVRGGAAGVADGAVGSGTSGATASRTVSRTPRGGNPSPRTGATPPRSCPFQTRMRLPWSSPSPAAQTADPSSSLPSGGIDAISSTRKKPGPWASSRSIRRASGDEGSPRAPRWGASSAKICFRKSKLVVPRSSSRQIGREGSFWAPLSGASTPPPPSPWVGSPNPAASSTPAVAAAAASLCAAASPLCSRCSMRLKVGSRWGPTGWTCEGQSTSRMNLLAAASYLSRSPWSSLFSRSMASCQYAGGTRGGGRSPWVGAIAVVGKGPRARDR